MRWFFVQCRGRGKWAEMVLLPSSPLGQVDICVNNGRPSPICQAEMERSSEDEFRPRLRRHCKSVYLDSA